MKFHHKVLKDNHNVSKESDSSLFLRYAWFLFFIMASIYALFFIFSFFVTQFISIEDEALFLWDTQVFSIDEELTESFRELYPDFPYTLWVADMTEKNAFATLWWNIYLTSWLIKSWASKNEIDFILWHEIGHIENRDVIRQIISTLPTYLFLMLLWSDIWVSVFETAIENPHSKNQETNADMYWLTYSMKKNGHIGCILNFFENENSLSDNIMTLFSGHPMTDTRMKRIRKEIEKKWYPDGECTPLKY